MTKPLKQGNCRIDAVDDEFIERAAKPHQRLVAVSPMHDEFADEQIVVWRIDTRHRPRYRLVRKAAWRMVIGDLARRRPEGCGMLGIDPAFDRMSLKDDILLGQREKRKEEPAAILICSLTRSTPVIISVTGCST